MNRIPALVILALAGLASAHCQSQDSGTPQLPSSASTIVEDPAPAPRKKLEIKNDDDGELELFVLKKVKAKVDREHFVFDHERREINYNTFTWKDGGILYRREGERTTTTLGIQYDARNKGVSILNISF